jgi:hypothetical protein
MLTLDFKNVKNYQNAAFTSQHLTFQNNINRRTPPPPPNFISAQDLILKFDSKNLPSFPKNPYTTINPKTNRTMAPTSEEMPHKPVFKE